MCHQPLGLILTVFALVHSLANATETVTTHTINGYEVFLVDVRSGNQFGYVFAVPYGSADDEPKMFGRAGIAKDS